MKELTTETLVAVLEEVFGFYVFWAMVVIGVLIIVAFVYLLLKERRLESGRFLYAEFVSPIGAIAAILFLQFITGTGFSDIGGPIDVILLVITGVFGALGLTILTYVIIGFSKQIF